MQQQSASGLRQRAAVQRNRGEDRPADLVPNELDTLEKEMAQYKEQDEDVLTYALFPQVATDFFKYRDAQEKKVDVTEADTKNGAYPV